MSWLWELTFTLDSNLLNRRKGKRHSGQGEDLPTVDVAYAQKSVPVVLGTIGYDYTTEELRQSAFLRKPLNTARADAAMDAYERHINDVALFGEDELTGLYTHPGVPAHSRPHNFSRKADKSLRESHSKLWSQTSIKYKKCNVISLR